MTEYIERDKVLALATPVDGCFSKMVSAWDITQLPAADVVEVVRGRWDEIPNRYMSISSKDGSYSGHATSCSVCHEVNPNVFKTNYCPSCGAKMDGDA